MEDKKAITILLNLLNKHPLDFEEKEAILSAIGLLDMSSIAKNILKKRAAAKKAKRDRDAER